MIPRWVKHFLIFCQLFRFCSDTGWLIVARIQKEPAHEYTSIDLQNTQVFAQLDLVLDQRWKGLLSYLADSLVDVRLMCIHIMQKISLTKLFWDSDLLTILILD